VNCALSSKYKVRLLWVSGYIEFQGDEDAEAFVSKGSSNLFLGLELAIPV
jgi:hypothetical protein